MLTNECIHTGEQEAARERQTGASREHRVSSAAQRSFRRPQSILLRSSRSNKVTAQLLMDKINMISHKTAIKRTEQA